MSTEDEARNLAPRRGATKFWSYVGTVIGLGAALLALQLNAVSGTNLGLMGFFAWYYLLSDGYIIPFMPAK